MHVGEAIVAALVSIGELFVLDAEQVQEGGLEIEDVDRILGRQESDEPLLASGRGILMMRAFMDDMRYEAGGRRLILTLGRPAAQEQRGQSRVPVQERVRVAPRADDGSVDWEGAYEGVARDLSPEGMALVQSRLAATDRGERR